MHHICIKIRFFKNLSLFKEPVSSRNLLVVLKPPKISNAMQAYVIIFVIGKVFYYIM